MKLALNVPWLGWVLLHSCVTNDPESKENAARSDKRNDNRSVLVRSLHAIQGKRAQRCFAFVGQV